MSRPRIVIIDDDLRQRELLKSVLAPIDADFLEFSEEKSCVGALGRIPLDLIITRIASSPQNADNLRALLKEEPFFGNLPRILIGHGEQGTGC